jgi:carbon storage regulator CsrA
VVDFSQLLSDNTPFTSPALTSEVPKMLVVPRKKGEAIVIGDEDIVVSVEEILGDEVRIGIACPRTSSVVERSLVGPSRSCLSSGTDLVIGGRCDGWKNKATD